MSRRLRSSLLIASSSLAFGLLAANDASAATATGMALNRFEPSERGSLWFSSESLDFDGKLQPAAGLVADWGYKPQEVRDATNTLQPVVKDQLALHVGAALTFFDRFQFAFNLPVYAVNTGTTTTRYDGTTYEAPSGGGVGDLRLGLQARIVGDPKGAFRLGAGVLFWAPTGKQSDLTSDGKVRLEPHVNIAGDVDLFAYSARVGFLWRGAASDGNSYVMTPIGNEVTYGASAGVKLVDGNLILGPEIMGSFAINSGTAIPVKNYNPFSLLIGGHYRAGDFLVGLGAGPGLSTAAGDAAFRVVGSIEWAPVASHAAPPPPPPPPPESDRDNDGIVDSKDACPDVKGVASDDPKKNGCPADRDGDGIADDVDACPDVKGVKSDDPKKNGCPADRDGDGIPDEVDACPDVKGVASANAEFNGCPPDKDGDGIKNEEDACPDAPGPKNADPKKNGCPAAAIVRGEIKILQQVKFATASDRILPESDKILTEVAKILKDHPEITKVRVEGHTDNQGNAKYNLDLSKKRAASVVKWLTTKGGIDAKRFDSEGYGQERPIASNDNEKGRQENRRVEFHIVDTTKPGAVKDK